jgi:hypothetical protein
MFSNSNLCFWWGNAFPLTAAQSVCGTPSSAKEIALCSFSAKPSKLRVGYACHWQQLSLATHPAVEVIYKKEH